MAGKGYTSAYIVYVRAVCQFTGHHEDEEPSEG